MIPDKMGLRGADKDECEAGRDKRARYGIVIEITREREEETERKRDRERENVCVFVWEGEFKYMRES